MADLTIWISGADFIKMGEFLAEEGRRLFENGGVFGRGRVEFFGKGEGDLTRLRPPQEGRRIF